MTFKTHPEPVSASVQICLDPFQLDVKRLYLPLVLTAKCPNCGGAVRHDLRTSYLSYPWVGEQEPVTLLCVNSDGDECCEFHVNLCLRVSATVETR